MKKIVKDYDSFMNENKHLNEALITVADKNMKEEIKKLISNFKFKYAPKPTEISVTYDTIKFDGYEMEMYLYFKNGTKRDMLSFWMEIGEKINCIITIENEPIKIEPNIIKKYVPVDNFEINSGMEAGIVEGLLELYKHIKSEY